MTYRWERVFFENHLVVVAAPFIRKRFSVLRAAYAIVHGLSRVRNYGCTAITFYSVYLPDTGRDNLREWNQNQNKKWKIWITLCGEIGRHTRAQSTRAAFLFFTIHTGFFSVWYAYIARARMCVYYLFFLYNLSILPGLIRTTRGRKITLYFKFFCYWQPLVTS